jgi:hypothetical protein
VKGLPSSLQLSFSFQVDRNGWSEADGSQFTINFVARFPHENYGYDERFSELLLQEQQGQSAADLTCFATIAQTAVAKMPHPGGEPDPDYPDDDFCDLNTTLDDSSGDTWMRYYDLDDVARWLREFIVPRLPRMLLGLERRDMTGRSGRPLT